MTSLKQSLLFLWMAATTALCIGLLINQFRDSPLPLVYQGKEERLQVAVERLATEPQINNETAVELEELPEFISLEEFSEFVTKGTNLILDARPEIFHRLGHVPGAISLPRDDFENAYKELREKLETDKFQSLILYCSHASCEDSELVKRSLRALGFKRITIFRGGWSEWTAAGKPEETAL